MQSTGRTGRIDKLIRPHRRRKPADSAATSEVRGIFQIFVEPLTSKNTLPISQSSFEKSGSAGSLER